MKERETKWTRVEPEKVLEYLPKGHEFVAVACVRIYQYIGSLEFSQILQISYKLSGENKFLFAKHRIKHDCEEEDIKRKFEGIKTYTRYL